MQMPPDNATTRCPTCGAARRQPGRARQILGWSLAAAAVAGGLLAAAAVAHALGSADQGVLLVLAAVAWGARVAAE
jgi:hypothetical protein